MIFAVIGFFRAGIADAPPEMAAAFNEHLGPSGAGLRIAGYLRDATGRKRGFLGLLEADSVERAESFLQSSPLYEGKLYDRAEALEFAIEVGFLH
ncbi:YciI family protein [Muricoccus nepalensis]|uniref:hypothetical protein n=1 Tax=Muricoccus nepalensis TaxID=1854500 RepID=UPI001127DC9E|nr:hypothetical protein [Roseomonas nepalensis]